jgi:hypothetical protein
MAAPGVEEARLTITAPFCAAVEETVGDWVGLTPPPPLFPPPHPIVKAFDSRIAVSIVAAAHIAELRFLESENLPALAYLTTRESLRQT